MKVTTALVYPAELNPGDEVWDFHDGHGGWARVVAISSGDHELLVWCDADSEPLHLPAAQRVEAHHVAPDFAADDEQVEHMRAIDERMSGWYAGDIEAAAAAYADHLQDTPPSGRTAIEIEPHFHGWYAGDLEYVVEHGGR